MKLRKRSLLIWEKEDFALDVLSVRIQTVGLENNIWRSIWNLHILTKKEMPLW